MGAGMVSIINIILDRLGTGWTYVLMGAICLVVTPLIWVIIKLGPGYRSRRRDRSISSS